MRADVPTIVGSSTTATTYNVCDMATASGVWLDSPVVWFDSPSTSGAQVFGGVPNPNPNSDAGTIRARRVVAEQFIKEGQVPQRRIVKVIIMDPNPSVPLEDCVLYRGEEQLTDLTDQELFFELDIKSLLASHNEKRVKMVDKSIKDRTEYLEPARVGGLKMLVVNVAAF